MFFKGFQRPTKVLNYAQYDLANERPFVYGPLDGRMGSSSKSVLCGTWVLVEHHSTLGTASRQ